jgi:diguanylate cyclase (GGDEF)-like protein
MQSPYPTVDPEAHTWLELGEVQQLLLDAYPGIVMRLDAEGKLRWINTAGTERLGFAREELSGHALTDDLIAREELEARAQELSAELGEHVVADAGVLGAAFHRGDASEEHEWLLHHKDGTPHPTRLAVAILRDNLGQVTGLIAVEKLAATGTNETLKLTHHDALTGLPTRAVLQDRAEMALIRATRQKTVLALMIIELADFAALTREHGRSVADDVLRATAGRLHFELRKTDTAIRLDGGQFAAMLVDLHEAGEATLVANKIAKSLSAPVNVGVARITPTARVGVAWFPEHGNQLLPLLHAAEEALKSLPPHEGGVACASPVTATH